MGRYFAFARPQALARGPERGAQPRDGADHPPGGLAAARLAGPGRSCSWRGGRDHRRSPAAAEYQEEEDARHGERCAHRPPERLEPARPARHARHVEVGAGGEKPGRGLGAAVQPDQPQPRLGPAAPRQPPADRRRHVAKVVQRPGQRAGVG